MSNEIIVQLFAVADGRLRRNGDQMSRELCKYDADDVETSDLNLEQSVHLFTSSVSDELKRDTLMTGK
jgi:hypothetical protein